MKIFYEAVTNALNLLLNFDPALIEITLETFKVTGAGLLISIIVGLPIGIRFGLRYSHRFSGCLFPIIYTSMGLPPVFVGLITYILLSNQGILGNLGWLFTPAAMVFAQSIISLPLIIGLSIAAFQSLDPNLATQIKSLGASESQLALTLLSEARTGIFAAIITAFGAIISEVGAVMLVGGNIEGETRVLTTAIVLETRKGNFALAMALGFILLGLAYIANYFLYKFQSRWGDK